MKRVLVIRYGAFGDLVMITPVLRLLKEDGFHVTANIGVQWKDVLLRNPNIDEFIDHDYRAVPNADLPRHWELLSKGYRLTGWRNVIDGKNAYAKVAEPFDSVINLTGSVETGLLVAEGRDKRYDLQHEERHRLFNVNYYDRTLELSGYGHMRGVLPELYFSPEEETWAQKFMRQQFGKFVILWSLSGSAFHKAYVHADPVAREFLNKHQDACTVTVGDDFCHMLEWRHSRTIAKAGKWPIRKSMVLAKHVNLVIGTETGVMNASACFDTPKIVLLSHSSEENLTKHWKNCTTLVPAVACHPCHQIHYSRTSCPTDEESLAPVCAAAIKPEELYTAIEAEYAKWKIKKEALHGIPSV